MQALFVCIICFVLCVSFLVLSTASYSLTSVSENSGEVCLNYRILYDSDVNSNDMLHIRCSLYGLKENCMEIIDCESCVRRSTVS
jgi:hypothetical protein